MSTLLNSIQISRVIQTRSHGFQSREEWWGVGWSLGIALFPTQLESEKHSLEILELTLKSVNFSIFRVSKANRDSSCCMMKLDTKLLENRTDTIEV